MRETRDPLVLPVNAKYQVDVAEVVADEAGSEFAVQAVRHRTRYCPPEHRQGNAARSRQRGREAAA